MNATAHPRFAGRRILVRAGGVAIPSYPAMLYLGCVAALEGDAEGCRALLGQAVQRLPWLSQQMANDTDLNSVRRKRMKNRVDILASLSLDPATLSEAAAIDDALQQQEKAAQQTLDATDAAIQGLAKRHGGIQEAVSNSPVDRPAEPGFYQE